MARRKIVNVMLVQTRISKGDYKRFDEMAAEQGMTIAALLRYMIRLRIGEPGNRSTSAP